ncbi:phosphopantetheine-binding protein [Svornostia abyssi]|uniref:Phosphopantetheine-binding protein n=1 Tax=Svornostia abyssi TaxID=2898438 RepID=A0ABY5PK37_9ACTN|nr:phosphopantetheine-binding protein [Parviterribacteraceae bacterium J379]
MADLTEEGVLQRVRDELEAIKVPGAENAELDTTWEELDVDSLDLVELIKALEDEYQIVISDDELKPVETVGDAVKLTLKLAGTTA